MIEGIGTTTPTAQQGFSLPGVMTGGHLSGLVTQAQEGNDGALQELFEETPGIVWSVLWRDFRDAPLEIKEDISQTVQLKLIGYIRHQSLRAEHDGAVISYLRRMTRHTAYNHLKQHRKYQPLPSEALAERMTEAGAAVRHDSDINLALARISRAEKEILVLKANGMTFRQIAERLAMKIHEVTRRYYKAVEKMRAFSSDPPFSFAGL